MEFDVAIIGAGLAGLSAAKEIVGENDLSVAIIEGRGIGSNNPSPLTFIEVAEEHGLIDCVREKYSCFSFHNINGSSISHIFSSDALIVLDYKQACKDMFSLIMDRKHNIECIDQMAVNLYSGPTNITIQLKNGRSIFAKIVIDASGSSQFVNKQFGLLNKSYYSHVYGAYFSNVKLPSTLR